ncbi:SDR family NAD(P)-dependent oxidoreductase [Novosphingobium lindaniclasticum]|uniref:3-hydroxy-2-methylbutyryl-CoA dehydrogenase n=1 Tax=Novosphingobium lindaniclasticum LE124 TaxID=1096930 RepID=T0HKI9_9SPHN|nr:SDR family NAD(P)-dependent oxidoreductase [Novosphingobium lindaniclasticum]EQB16826.1 3-hydroxy-2-methylbutyryl-CoA dehydrogenase [Novosphingobium lindaniclasticum LE124]
MDIKGLAAVVTGGASGLGGAAASRLAKAGARVTILDLNPEMGEAHARAIGGHFIRADVTDEAGVANALDEAAERHGTARVLVNCAGIGAPARILDRNGESMPLANFSRVVTVNLMGTFNVLSKFAARLQGEAPVGPEERGVIINTASVAAYDGQIGQVPYAASKGGIVGMTLPVAREFARLGIRVMTIAPGIFRTPQLGTLPQDVLDSLGAQVPFPSRLGEVDEFAALVEHIAANPMLNGEVIRLDGAIRMAPK